METVSKGTQSLNRPLALIRDFGKQTRQSPPRLTPPSLGYICGIAFQKVIIVR